MLVGHLFKYLGDENTKALQKAPMTPERIAKHLQYYDSKNMREDEIVGELVKCGISEDAANRYVSFINPAFYEVDGGKPEDLKTLDGSVCSESTMSESERIVYCAMVKQFVLPSPKRWVDLKEDAAPLKQRMTALVIYCIFVLIPIILVGLYLLLTSFRFQANS